MDKTEFHNLKRIIATLSIISLTTVFTACVNQTEEADSHAVLEPSTEDDISYIIDDSKDRDKKQESEDAGFISSESSVSDHSTSSHTADNIVSTQTISELRKEKAVTISAGIRSITFLKDDGSVTFFGDDYSGQAQAGEWTGMLSVEGFGYVTIGLTEDGEIKTVGKCYDDIDTSQWEKIVQVAAGEQYVVGLCEDGTVVATGHKADGQCDVDNWSDIKMIAAGWRHTVGVDSNDNVFITGYHAEEQLKQISKEKDKWNGIVKIVAGGGYEKNSGHTVALKEDGTVVAVGNNTYVQCDVSSWNDIIDVAAGDWHTVGLKSDGTVVVTGDYGVLNPDTLPLSKWQDIVAVSAGRGYTIGLKKDGTVLIAGYDHENGSQLASQTTGIKIYDEWYSIKNRK